MFLVTITGGFLCHSCYGVDLRGGVGEKAGIGVRLPKDDNAWHHQVLQVDPRNPVARQGMKSVLFHYVSVAQAAMARGEFYRAERASEQSLRRFARLNARRAGAPASRVRHSSSPDSCKRQDDDGASGLGARESPPWPLWARATRTSVGGEATSFRPRIARRLLGSAVSAGSQPGGELLPNSASDQV